MKFKDLLDKVRNTTSPFARDESIPDDQTTDKRLRTLRRQRRTQLEELEKERLHEEILAHQRMRGSQAIIGDGKSPLQSKKTPLKRRPSQTYFGKGGLL